MPAIPETTLPHATLTVRDILAAFDALTAEELLTVSVEAGFAYRERVDIGEVAA